MTVLNIKIWPGAEFGTTCCLTFLGFWDSCCPPFLSVPVHTRSFPSRPCLVRLLFTSSSQPPHWSGFLQLAYFNHVADLDRGCLNICPFASCGVSVPVPGHWSLCRGPSFCGLHSFVQCEPWGKISLYYVILCSFLLEAFGAHYMWWARRSMHFRKVKVKLDLPQTEVWINLCFFK